MNLFISVGSYFKINLVLLIKKLLKLVLHMLKASKASGRLNETPKPYLAAGRSTCKFWLSFIFTFVNSLRVPKNSIEQSKNLQCKKKLWLAVVKFGGKFYYCSSLGAKTKMCIQVFDNLQTFFFQFKLGFLKQFIALRFPFKGAYDYSFILGIDFFKVIYDFVELCFYGHSYCIAYFFSAFRSTETLFFFQLFHVFHDTRHYPKIVGYVFII